MRVRTFKTYRGAERYAKKLVKAHPGTLFKIAARECWIVYSFHEIGDEAVWIPCG